MNNWKQLDLKFSCKKYFCLVVALGWNFNAPGSSGLWSILYTIKANHSTAAAVDWPSMQTSQNAVLRTATGFHLISDVDHLHAEIMILPIKKKCFFNSTRSTLALAKIRKMCAAKQQPKQNQSRNSKHLSQLKYWPSWCTTHIRLSFNFNTNDRSWFIAETKRSGSCGSIALSGIVSYVKQISKTITRCSCYNNNNGPGFNIIPKPLALDLKFFLWCRFLWWRKWSLVLITI